LIFLINVHHGVSRYPCFLKASSPPKYLRTSKKFEIFFIKNKRV